MDEIFRISCSGGAMFLTVFNNGGDDFKTNHMSTCNPSMRITEYVIKLQGYEQDRRLNVFWSGFTTEECFTRGGLNRDGRNQLMNVSESNKCWQMFRFRSLDPKLVKFVT